MFQVLHIFDKKLKLETLQLYFRRFWIISFDDGL